MPHISVPAIPSGDDIAIQRGDTLIVSVTRLGDINARSNLWFTVKQDRADEDIESLIQIDETTGLLYIDGTAATVAANGSITVTDAVRGDLTVSLAAEETAKLGDDQEGDWHYDIQMIDGAGAVTTLIAGDARMTQDVSRATS